MTMMRSRAAHRNAPGGAAKAGKSPSRSRSSSSSSSSSWDSHGRAGKDNKDKPMLLVPAPPPKKPKRLAPQAAIDDFWAKFDSKTPGRAATLLPKRSDAKKADEKKVPKGAIEGENAVSSYEEAAKRCKEKVAKIVKECRRINQKYVDNHFNIQFDLEYGQKDCLTMLTSSSDDTYAPFYPQPGSVKRVTDIFDNPKFFVEGPTANDIRQGRDGDCWFMAALCTLGNKEGLIEKVCVARDEQVGVYGFVFYRDGEWISEIIDDMLYLIKPDYDTSWEERNLIEDHQRIDSEEDYRRIYQSNSQALYFAQCENPNETWLPLMEKAYAKAHGDYAAIEGGFTGEGLEDLTGGVTTEVFSTNILDKEYFWKEELMKVNKDFLFGCWGGIFGGRGERKGIVEGHAYSIMKCVEIDGKRLCLLRNPWGQKEWTGPWSDGSKEWTPEWMEKLDHRFGDDGAFWMSYEDLLKKYQIFDRTRLFTDDWKVTQQWTSVNVPWSLDYNDTKFSFTLEKKAPVVIVLSQLDSRYFCGLEDQYSFRLAFRVHKAGDDDYLVRSINNVLMHRSVTAELELEAGEYHVLMKIEAERNTSAAHVEDVVRNNVRDRREKLLRIGLAYDLAHAKGQIYETPEEKKGRKKAAKTKTAKEKKEMKDKLMKEKLLRKHTQNREDRKTRAAKIKRKEKAKAKEERVKAKEAEERETDKEAVVEDKKGEKTEEESKKDEKLEANQEEDKEEKSEKDKKDEETKKDEKPEDDKKDEKPEEESKKDLKPEEEGKTDQQDQKPDSTPKETAETTKPETGEAAEPPKPASAPENDGISDTKASSSESVSTTLTPSASELSSTEKKPAKEPRAPTPPPTHPLPSVDFPPSDTSDDESDIVSIVSDISSAAVEEAIAEAALAARNAIPAPVIVADEEDEFQNDPWNAVAVLGLRVYSKESSVSVRIVRPRDWEEDGEGKLDVDDPAADAMKEGSRGRRRGSKKTEEGSEGSGVVV